MMNIISAGDSFTYGEELSDVNNAWPFLLGQKLNGQVTNLAEPAGSNDKVIRKVMEYIANEPIKPDLVLIGWANPGRIEFADEHGYYDFWPGYQGNLFERDSAHWRNELCKYFSVYHSRSALYLRYLQQVILMQHYLKSLGIKYIMMDVLARDYYKDVHQSYYGRYQEQVDKNHFIDFQKAGMLEWTYGCPMGPRNHFLDEGHAIVTEKVYEHVKSLGWV
jgi:hypothetical protein